MNDAQLLRYSRHILLDDVGIEGQERLMASRALVVGVGGLGSPVALYLAAARLGSLTLVDDDEVDLTNFQRQILHGVDGVGMPQVESAALRLGEINPGVEVAAVRERAGPGRLLSLAAAADVVVDCSDNFPIRQAVNAACVALGKPLVSGSAMGFHGQVSVFDSRDPAMPCYACLFPPGDAVEEARCSTMGVFAPLVGIVGSVQAAEALKLLAGVGPSLAGRLQMLDARSMAWSEIRVGRVAACSVCVGRPALLESQPMSAHR